MNTDTARRLTGGAMALAVFLTVTVCVAAPVAVTGPKMAVQPLRTGAWSHLRATQDAIAHARRLSPMEEGVFDRVFKRKDAVGAAAAEWFMRSAVLQIRPSEGEAYGGFYNSMSDTWLLTRLNYVDGGWRISDAILAESPGAARQPWFTAGDRALKQLSKSNGLALSSFGSGGGGFQPIGDQVLRSRAAPWLGSLEELHKQRRATRTAANVIAAIAADKPKDIDLTDKAALRRLAGLAPGARADFAVEGAAIRKDGATLFIVSAGAPSVLVLATLDAGGDLLGVSIVDLAMMAGEGA